MPRDGIGSSILPALQPRNRSKMKASTKMTSARLREDLRSLAEAATSLKDARPPSITSLRVVLGIFSQEGWVAQRSAHRSSWMQNELVCRRADFALGCSIIACFVVQDTITLAQIQSRSAEPDLFVLSGSSSRFHALLKTVAWMCQAPIAFAHLSPSHVGKMDMDTFVWPPSLLQELAHLSASSSTATYYGLFMGGRRVSELCTTRINAARTRTNAICGCPPHDCHSLQDDTMKAKVVQPVHQGGGHCWWFAQGGFYLVTPSLARIIGRAEQALLRDERSYANSTTCEDILVGRLLFEGNTQHLPHNVLYLSGSGEGCLSCRPDWRDYEQRQHVLREVAKRPWVHLYYSSTAATRAWLS